MPPFLTSAGTVGDQQFSFAGDRSAKVGGVSVKGAGAVSYTHLGRADLLSVNRAIDFYKAQHLDFSSILHAAEGDGRRFDMVL